MEQLIISALLVIALISHIIAVTLREVRHKRAIDELTSKIAAQTVERIVSGSVTTARIADMAITEERIAGINTQ